jgi:hypothetical protein
VFFVFFASKLKKVLTTHQNYAILLHMTRIIALSPKKKTRKAPYKSPARLAAKKELLAKKVGKGVKK